MSSEPALRRRARRALLTAAAGAWTIAAILAASGGVSFRVAGFPVRARRPAAALILGIVCAAAALASGGPAGAAQDLGRAWRRRRTWSAAAAAVAAVFAGVAGAVWGTWAASGADAYGYVSQALAWTHGWPVLPQPIAASAPWPSPEWTLSPFGWRPALVPGAIVPTYAPGLPLLMAVAARAAGESAVYLVVPVSAALLVWLTWRLGLILADRAAAAAAAVLMACSPTLLFQAVQPMSDVPVAAWLTAALVLVLARKPGWAGACAAGAVLTRPNLAPLALWLALGTMMSAPGRVPADTRVRLRGLLVFVATASAGVLLWLATNRAWYGDPFASGYGSFGELFSVANVGPNLRRYAEWLLHTQTPFVLLGLTSPLALAWASRRESPATADEAADADVDAPSGPPTPGSLRAHAFALGFAVLVVLAYLPYAPFDAWSYLRFLLPAFPVLLVTSASVATTLLARAPVAARLPVLALLVGGLATYQCTVARDGQAFQLRRLEHRYVDAGAWAARALPGNALFLSVQQSGSLRLYAGRPTVRWDLLDPAWLERALTHLRQQGYAPYLVLEAWEEVQFREHFSGAGDLGRLDWPPAAEIRTTPRVRFYDPRDRARFLAGEPLATVRIDPTQSR